MTESEPQSGSKRASPIAETEVVYNVNPWGFLLGVAAALFGVLFAFYALLRVRQALIPTAPAAKAPATEIPIDME